MPGKSLKRQAIEEAAKLIVEETMALKEQRYLKAFDRQAYGYALLGHTDQEIAELIGVSESTFDTWKVEQSSLRAALRKARVDDHVRLVKSLHRAGRGYRTREDKLLVVGGEVQRHSITKAYPPNVKATEVILNNRLPRLWKDSKTVDKGDHVDLLAAIREAMGDGAKLVNGSAEELLDRSDLLPVVSGDQDDGASE
jgi:hypothetical protein